MDEDLLTTEQRYLLRQVELQAQAMDRDELIAALCDAWEARFRQKQSFIFTLQGAGLATRIEERQPCLLPDSDEELRRWFGHLPDEDELNAFFQEQWETATMELDMDEIVQTPDDDVAS